MATEYLKEALASKLKDMGGLDMGEFDVIIEAWEKDIKDLNKMLDKDIEVKPVKDGDTGNFIIYQVSKGGEVIHKTSDVNRVVQTITEAIR